MFMYDTQTGGYAKFDGGPASLAAELEDTAKRVEKHGSMVAKLAEDTDVIKQRITTIATADNVKFDQLIRNE